MLRLLYNHILVHTNVNIWDVRKRNKKSVLLVEFLLSSLTFVTDSGTDLVRLAQNI